MLDKDVPPALDFLGGAPCCAAGVRGGCGHEYVGYMPTPEAHAEGGYEVNDAHQCGGLWEQAIASRTRGIMAVYFGGGSRQTWMR